MLLKDTTLQNELKENGFIVIPFLNNDETKALQNFYTEIHGQQDPPLFIEEIHMTSWCPEKAYKEKVSKGLQSIFEPATKRFFKDFRSLNNVFIIKKNGKNTTFKVHQDWNVVDETLYESVNVWIPMHDVNETSGALWVLRGSHRINRKIRGAGYLFPEYGKYFRELEEKAVSVNLKAGQAIVFYHSVIHGSPPNLSDNLRIAACFSVIPKNAPLCIYHQPLANAPLRSYQPNDDFIFQYDYLRTETLTRPPAETPVSEKESYINKPVTLEELKPLLHPTKKWFSFFRK
ncbi:MAG: phytanoyl-CoA dioxygenase family protein [Bacteroidia bacterium]|nr:phytanoyl-CoA dioxygenase family protein [Bacteroidia bacterium]